MSSNEQPAADDNTPKSSATAADGDETPSIKQLVDFEALSQLMQQAASLTANLNERLQGGVKGGFCEQILEARRHKIMSKAVTNPLPFSLDLDGGRISNNNVKQQVEEVCALKKKLEDLEPVIKKAVIMAEPEPVPQAPLSKRAARGKVAKSGAASTAVTDEHDQRIGDLETSLADLQKKVKATQEENKKLGTLVAQLETKAGKQSASSPATQAQVQNLSSKLKTVSQYPEQMESLRSRITDLEDTTSPANLDNLLDKVQKDVQALQQTSQQIQVRVRNRDAKHAAFTKSASGFLSNINEKQKTAKRAHQDNKTSIKFINYRLSAVEARIRGAEDQNGSNVPPSGNDESDSEQVETLSDDVHRLEDDGQSVELSRKWEESEIAQAVNLPEAEYEIEEEYEEEEEEDEDCDYGGEWDDDGPVFGAY